MSRALSESRSVVKSRPSASATNQTGTITGAPAGRSVASIRNAREVSTKRSAYPSGNSTFTPPWSIERGLRPGAGDDMGRGPEHQSAIVRDVGTECIVGFRQHALDLVLRERRANQGQPAEYVGLDHRAKRWKPPGAVVSRQRGPRCSRLGKQRRQLAGITKRERCTQRI